jgi:hypothetical protein
MMAENEQHALFTQVIAYSKDSVYDRLFSWISFQDWLVWIKNFTQTKEPLILREVNGRVCNCATYRIEKPVEILILISVPSYCHVNDLTPYLSSFSRIDPLLSILN